LENDSPHHDTDTSGAEKSELDSTIKVAFIIFCIAIALLFLAIFVRIIMADVNLWDRDAVPPDTETAALIAANERVLQLVQWTVSTILVVAGGLLGLNWYQNQKRYDDDKADLARFRRDIERRYQRDHAEIAQVKRELDARVSRAEQAQETLAEHHRSHLLVQAVNEVTSTDSVEEAFSVIVSWYGQIREVDNSEQQRALTLLWQGFEYIVELLEEGAPPVFHSGDPAAQLRFRDFLGAVKSAYPEVTEYVDVFEKLAVGEGSGDKKAGA
jgi:hypothetical protein